MEKTRNIELREDMIFDEKKEIIEEPQGSRSSGFWPMQIGPLREWYERDDRSTDYSGKRFLATFLVKESYILTVWKFPISKQNTE
jgi:hypothetical protein